MMGVYLLSVLYIQMSYVCIGYAYMSCMCCIYICLPHTHTRIHTCEEPSKAASTKEHVLLPPSITRTPDPLLPWFVLATHTSPMPCDMTPLCVCHDSFVFVTWLIRSATWRCSYVRHDLSMWAPWLIHMCAMIRFSHPHIQCPVTWLFHMSAMTHSYVCHDSFICAPLLIHMCTVTHSYVRHDWFTCVTWLMYVCAMTHSHVCYDSF